jgi:hypothetical protein
MENMIQNIILLLKQCLTHKNCKRQLSHYMVPTIHNPSNTISRQFSESPNFQFCLFQVHFMNTLYNLFPKTSISVYEHYNTKIIFKNIQYEYIILMYILELFLSLYPWHAMAAPLRDASDVCLASSVFGTKTHTHNTATVSFELSALEFIWLWLWKIMHGWLSYQISISVIKI